MKNLSTFNGFVNESEASFERKHDTYLGRPLLHEVSFPASGTFSAIGKAEEYLRDLGYTKGSMSQQEPIGVAHGVDYIAKWYNIPREDKDKLDGVIIPEPDFREGGVRILFFTPPKY
jgi:hypothetical protein